MKLALLALLSGCTVLQQPAATVGCQSADAATTLYAVRHGATELNPFMRPLLAAGAGVFLLAKVGITLLLLQTDPQVQAGANVVTCGAAAHNLMVIR